MTWRLYSFATLRRAALPDLAVLVDLAQLQCISSMASVINILHLLLASRPPRQQQVELDQRRR